MRLGLCLPVRPKDAAPQTYNILLYLFADQFVSGVRMILALSAWKARGGMKGETSSSSPTPLHFAPLLNESPLVLWLPEG